MSMKPDDIPQEVWDTAIAIETGYEGGEGGRRPLFIARAIMAAVEGEREACALIAADYYDHPVELAAFIGEEIADAIRDRQSKDG